MWEWCVAGVFMAAARRLCALVELVIVSWLGDFFLGFRVRQPIRVPEHPLSRIVEREHDRLNSIENHIHQRAHNTTHVHSRPRSWIANTAANATTETKADTVKSVANPVNNDADAYTVATNATTNNRVFMRHAFP